ncbi:MAG: DUF6442 family protein [Defluviitaleaceae bacterium]|nr:DUF6442 family protein [Defluviitaleaceae bacterium]
MTEYNGNRKEEILARSRQSKKDEGVEHATIKGLKLGEITGGAMAMVLVFLAFFLGQPVAFFAIGAVIFALAFGQSLAVYRFKRTKYLLAWVIISIMGMFHFFMLFLAATQEWTVILDRFWRWGA